MLDCHKGSFEKLQRHLLFPIHFNDLQDNTSLRILNFADDTLLYTTFNQNTYVQGAVNLK